MLNNRFTEYFFANAAGDELGLQLYSLQEIQETTFYDDVKEGDFFLQFRRPTASWASFRVNNPEYTDAEKAALPCLLSQNNLTHPCVGFVNHTSPAEKPAFRIFVVEEILGKNEWKTSFKALSVYDSGTPWAFGQVKEGYSAVRVSKWKRSCSYFYRPKTLSFRKGCPEEGKGRTGVIGKLDKGTLAQFLEKKRNIKTGWLPEETRWTSYSPKSSFYPLWRALTSDGIDQPAVKKAMEGILVGNLPTF